ncbi:MAG TPA: hypothetical protein VNZ85_06030 [Caulobacter sp.]|nr:hypothetical protein [Caulobacter sp.]
MNGSRAEKPLWPATGRLSKRLANQDGVADLEVINQVELGAEIMDAYGETFSALAKPR